MPTSRSCYCSDENVIPWQLLTHKHSLVFDEAPGFAGSVAALILKKIVNVYLHKDVEIISESFENSFFCLVIDLNELQVILNI